MNMLSPRVGMLTLHHLINTPGTLALGLLQGRKLHTVFWPNTECQVWALTTRIFRPLCFKPAFAVTCPMSIFICFLQNNC